MNYWTIREWKVNQSGLPEDLFEVPGTLTTDNTNNVASTGQCKLSWHDQSGRRCELVLLGKAPEEELYVEDGVITVDGEASIPMKSAHIRALLGGLSGRLKGSDNGSGEPGTIAAEADPGAPPVSTEPA